MDRPILVVVAQIHRRVSTVIILGMGVRPSTVLFVEPLEIILTRLVGCGGVGYVGRDHRSAPEPEADVPFVVRRAMSGLLTFVYPLFGVQLPSTARRASSCLFHANFLSLLCYISTVSVIFCCTLGYGGSGVKALRHTCMCAISIF